MLRIKTLKCHNVKGFLDFEVEPGQVTLFAGANATNKTSGLALLTGLFGQANGRILRAGCTEGEIFGVLEDVDSGETFEVRRVFREGKAETPSVKSSKVGRIGASATFLKNIIDPISLDPIDRAMNASEEEQGRILLESMPLELPEQTVIAAVDHLVPEKAIEEALKKPALPALDALHDLIYEKRTDLNKEAKSKTAHAAELKASVQSVTDKDWQAEIYAVEERIAVAGKEELAEITKSLEEWKKEEVEVRRKAKADTEIMAATFDGEVALLRRKIAELEAEIGRSQTAKVAAIQGIENARLQESQIIEQELRKDLETIEAKYRPEREARAAEKGSAVVKAKAQVEAQTTLSIAEKAEKAAESLQSRANAHTAALANLEKIREGLLDQIPIKELTYQKGIPYLDGVPLSEINEQRKTDFWVRVGAMRARDLGVCVIDRCERYDSNHFVRLVEAIKKTDIQWFLARVDDGDFRVESY